jgi:hypothetical protein
MNLLRKFESIQAEPLATNVFAYGQWGSSERKLVQVNEQLSGAQTLAPQKPAIAYTRCYGQ